MPGSPPSPQTDGTVGSGGRRVRTGVDPVLQSPARLALLGYGVFRQQHQRTHQRMDELGIAHLYRDGPQRQHAWESGWLPEAVTWLTADATQD